MTYYPQVPYVPTPNGVVRRMLEIANLKPGEVLYDLGCGDGRIVIMAAKEFGAKAIGVEIREDLVKQCYKEVIRQGLENRVKIIHGDFFKVDISEADVVTLYLLTSVNEMLKPKLEKELRNGTRVVSHDFEVTGWRPTKEEVFSDEWRSHRIYLYIIKK